MEKKSGTNLARFIAWAFTIYIMIIFGFCLWGYLSLNGRVSALEGVNPQVFTDKQAIIDFLKDERGFMMWMLGVISASAIVLLTFFGLNTKKGMEAIFSRKYSEKVDEVIEKYEKAFDERLQGAIEKEKAVKSKKILFICHKDEEKTLKPSMDFFKDHMYSVYMITSDRISASEASVMKNIGDAAVVVYQINPLEAQQPEKSNEDEAANRNNGRTKDTAPSSMLYPLLARICERERKNCLIYTGNFRIDTALINKYEYTVIANMPSTLRQWLFSVLYFTK